MANINSSSSKQAHLNSVQLRDDSPDNRYLGERSTIPTDSLEQDDLVSRTSVAPLTARQPLPTFAPRSNSAPPVFQQGRRRQSTIMEMAAHSFAEAIRSANEVLGASQEILRNVQGVSNNQAALGAAIDVLNGQIQELRHEFSTRQQPASVSLPPTKPIEEQVALLRTLMPRPLEDSHFLAANSVLNTKFAAEMTPSDSDKLNRLMRQYTHNTIFQLNDISAYQLDRLWTEDNGDRYRQLIVEMQSVRVNIHWTNSEGRTRTIPTGLGRFQKKSKYKGDDVVFAEEPIKRAFRASSSGLRGANEIRAHCALALQCLHRNDISNFARIVGCVPSDIIDALLAKKHLRPGPLFRDDVIWEVIAQSIPRLIDKPIDTVNQRTSIRNAFCNYLDYHGIPLDKPYRGFQKITYPLSAEKIDGLSANRREFFETILRVIRASSNPSSLLKILDHKHDFPSLCRSSFYILEEVLAGAEAHLDGFSKRIEQNKRRNLGIIKSIATAGKAAVGMGTAFDPTGVSAAIIDMGADVGTAAIAAKLAALHTESVPDYLASWVQSLKTEIFHENLSPGTFVHGHPHLSIAQAAALRAEHIDGHWVVGGGDLTALTESEITETHRNREHLSKIFPDISESKMKDVAAARDAWTQTWKTIRSGR